MIAITIICASLFALAYTATIGFSYMDLARQKDAATGFANQVMEGARGLAYSKITTGMLSTDITSDSRIVSCSGVYRFLSCTAGSTKGSGEKIVYSTSPTAVNPTAPLIPHTTTSTVNGVTYTASIYDSQDDSISSAPYRLTVIVTWSGGRTNATKLVQIQSLFWSPNGCRSTTLHPFAAPCQPFFFGAASVPAGDIKIAGTVDGTTFSSGDLLTPDVESNVQIEQVSQVQGTVTRSAVSLTDNGSLKTAGGTVATTTAADTDPGSGSGVYARTRCPTDETCGGGTAVAQSGNGQTSFTFSAPSGDTFETDSTTSANSTTNVCPPPTASGETDLLPCGGSREQQGGALSAVLDMKGINSGTGSAMVAQVLQAASSPVTTFVNRVAYPTSALCTPVSTSDGCLEQTVSRTFGTINIGGLPSGMTTTPANWTGASAWNGYFLSIVGYTDTANAAAGISSPLPTAAVTAGTVYYWNGSGYSNLAATAAGLSAITPTFSWSQPINGHTVKVDMSLQASSTTAATTSTAATPGTAGNVTRTDVTAAVTPPRTTVVYTVSVDNVPKVSLTIDVNLKSMDVRGSYAAAPVQGS